MRAPGAGEWGRTRGEARREEGTSPKGGLTQRTVVAEARRGAAAAAGGGDGDLKDPGGRGRGAGAPDAGVRREEEAEEEGSRDALADRGRGYSSAVGGSGAGEAAERRRDSRPDAEEDRETCAPGGRVSASAEEARRNGAPSARSAPRRTRGWDFSAAGSARGGLSTHNFDSQTHAPAGTTACARCTSAATRHGVEDRPSRPRAHNFEN